uniref:BrkDBD domain-containing protein n=1 Tax=Caenorhabditis tropicalis TaxID=1561998 RepID=A0A1I7V2S4_9PELO
MSSDVRKVIDPGAPYSRTLKQYSIDEKLAIISHAKNHGNRAAGREFNVAESSIREWRKNENKLIHNKKQAALSATNSQVVQAPPPSLLNKINNNNNNFNKNLPIRNGGIFGMSQENLGGVPKREDLIKFQLLAMMNMDLAQFAPLLQLQRPPANQNIPSTDSGTPSSSSSSTPPPSLSPVGSGRRKPRCPQKIVNDPAL